MPTAPPLQALQVFLAVARRRSFTQAARDLGVTPSAVSQAVRQLEAQMGVPLLARTTRSVGLTGAGCSLVEAAGPGIAQAVAALGRAAAQAGELVGRRPTARSTCGTWSRGASAGACRCAAR